MVNWLRYRRRLKARKLGVAKIEVIAITGRKLPLRRSGGWGEVWWAFANEGDFAIAGVDFYALEF